MANEGFWVYLRQPGSAPFYKSIWISGICLFVLLNELDVISENSEQCTLNSHFLIKMFPDVDARFLAFGQKQNTCISRHAVANSS